MQKYSRPRTPQRCPSRFGECNQGAGELAGESRNNVPLEIEELSDLPGLVADVADIADVCDNDRCGNIFVTRF